ncbi:MAG TPA: mechanosensitive ion channel family protein [Candidatus Limnocylindria bacterium]|nr:mechanosensitive ion channel family protein [Candidatus Limnocylindria bacterium]
MSGSSYEGPRRVGRRAQQVLHARGQAWREGGLTRRLSQRAAKRARMHLLVVLPMLVGVWLIYRNRETLLGEEWDKPVRIVTAIALIALGWEIARDVGRALSPTLFRRLDPGTAGTVGFLIRLVTMLVAVAVAAHVSNLDPRTLALGGAFTAVVVGLAAQQTIGHLIAGIVLLSARPFRVGERIRLQGGGLAGEVEGVVSSLGLLYTTLARGEDPILIPNAVLLNLAIEPLREPVGIDIRARLRPGVTPLDLQQLLQETITTPLRGPPRITVEELDGDEVVVRIAAVPQRTTDGPRLAGEVLSAVASQTTRAAA